MLSIKLLVFVNLTTVRKSLVAEVSEVHSL